MREIKFRAWHNDFGEMVYTGKNYEFGKREFTPFLFEVGFSNYPQSDWVIMQYTGLKDKDGKEIYESDIDQDGGRIFYNESIAAFQIDYGGDVDIADMEDVDKWMVVSGNIYESPELLNPLNKQS